MAYATLRYFLYVIPLLHFISSATCAPSPRLSHLLGAQGVNLWKLEAAKAASGFTTSHPLKRSPELLVQDAQLMNDRRTTTDFRARWFQQPLDHFSNDSGYTFYQRYWVNDRHYVPGGSSPVIVLDGGETSGEVCFSTNF